MSTGVRNENIAVHKKQKSKKVTRKKANMSSRSKIYKKIVDSLEKGEYQHMLYWSDKMKKEFIVKFVHMNNPEWVNANYLELFIEWDKLSNNYEEYLQDEKYDHKCKLRGKANLGKLVKSGALTNMGKTTIRKSIQLKKYKLNFDVSSAKSAVSKGWEMTKGFNVINIYVNIPVGEPSISSASSIGYPLLDVRGKTENMYGVNRNVILPKQPLAVFEHEKQMDENNGALPTENQNMELEGKFIFPNGNDPVKEVMGTINIASTHNASSGCNELQYSNNSFIELQNEVFQDMESETKNYAQLVPNSPQNFDRIINDPLPQWYEDYRPDVNKPLQKDNDPLWFESYLDRINDNLPEENGILIANNEDSFAFENYVAV